jgi:hypothetical protein
MKNLPNQTKQHVAEVGQVKGIVSKDFGTLFMISLDRFEGRNRAGSCSFFILRTFSSINFKNFAWAVKILPSKESRNCYHLEEVLNAMCHHSHYTEVMNPGIVTIRREVWNAVCQYSHYMG